VAFDTHIGLFSGGKEYLKQTTSHIISNVFIGNYFLLLIDKKCHILAKDCSLY